MADRPQGVPDSAVPIPSSAATPFPAVQVQTVSNIAAYVTLQAKTAKADFAAKCDNWRINALHCRDLGIPLPPKPEVPNVSSIQTLHDEATDTVWIWTTSTPADVPPCPDLPAIAAKQPAGTAHIGGNIYGPWFECFADDTIARNEFVTLNAQTGPTPAGKYQKIGGAMPGMNWYLKVA